MEAKLAQIETLLTAHIKRQDEINEQLKTLCERHAYFIDGNGIPGAKVRIDRLEQDNKRRDIWTGAALVSVVGLAIKAAWSHFTGGTT